jgi:hypothetical protein
MSLPISVSWMTLMDMTIVDEEEEAPEGKSDPALYAGTR